MKLISLFALVFLAAKALSVHAQTNADGWKTNVWAGPGLNLRKTPDFKSDILATLPYGTSVELLEYAEIVKGRNEISGDYEEPAEVDLKVYNGGYLEPTYQLRGSWVKARAIGQEGYLFDAYLSSMQPYAAPETWSKAYATVAEGMAAMHDYYAKQQGILRSNEGAIIFNDGTFFKTEDPKVETCKWIFPAISEHDGYLLVNYFLSLEKKSNSENAEGFRYGGGSNSGLGSSLSFDYQASSNWVLEIRFYRETMMIISEWGGD